MKYNYNNWPFKWYGLWKEYGTGYENYPSIKEFIDQQKNRTYNKERLIEYLNTGVVVATTSKRNFISPFKSDNESGSISFRTDGKWLWLDNISEFISHNELTIPENWYNEILDRDFIIPEVAESQLQGLEWPSI